MVKFGVNAWSFPRDVSIEEIFRKTRESGFEGFEAALNMQDVEKRSL